MVKLINVCFFSDFCEEAAGNFYLKTTTQPEDPQVPLCDLDKLSELSEKRLLKIKRTKFCLLSPNTANRICNSISNHSLKEKKKTSFRPDRRGVNEFSMRSSKQQNFNFL